MNLVFASDSIWNWDAEKNYRILVEENPELVQAARRGSSVVDPETGLPKEEKLGQVNGEADGVRKASLVADGGRRPSLNTGTDEKRRGSLVPKK